MNVPPPALRDSGGKDEAERVSWAVDPEYCRISPVVRTKVNSDTKGK
jgi:hypothetical protein